MLAILGGQIVLILWVFATLLAGHDCALMYEYVKQDGTTGMANMCYNTERGKVCREDNRSFVVVEYKQGDVCKND